MLLKFYPEMPRLQNVPPLAVTVCVGLFVIGMALLGSHKLAGGFYILSLVLGLYLLWRLPRVRITLPPAIKLYLGFYLAFVGLVVVHVLILSASGSNIDQVSRIGLGLLSGFIFFALCGFSREKLFDLVVLVAAAHASVAIIVAIYQGIDFTTLKILRSRSHGVTNAIPFSEMLFTSLGLVAIGLAAKLDTARSKIGIVILAMIVGVGIFAVFLTKTRGTLSAFVLLLPLLLVALSGRVSLRLTAVLGAVFLAGALVAARIIFAREPVMLMFLDFLKGAPATAYIDSSVGIRLQLWTYGIDLFRSAPIFGHGINSFPQLLERPELGVAEDSILMNFGNVHNIYIDILMKMGIVGAVFFFVPLAIAIGAGLRMAFKLDTRVMGLAILWVAGSYAIYGLTQVFYGHASTTLHYGVFVGMLLWLTPGGRYGEICQRPETVS